MSSIQWLLIGGPAHGKAFNIKGGSSIRYPHTDGEDYLYNGATFVLRGKDYRLGVCHTEGGQSYSDDMKATLIESSGVKPIDTVS